MKIDWYLRIGIQDNDFIISINWEEGNEKNLIKKENTTDKNEIIKILEKTIKMLKNQED